jgi:multiple antibiotic resistance protein
VHNFGHFLALGLAIVAVFIVVWLAMRFSTVIQRVLTDNGVELLTRISGLLLAAISVQLIATAVLAFAKQA